MIETTLKDYLQIKLGDIPVKLEMPINPPEEIVILVLTSGNETNHINHSTFAVKCYSSTLAKTAALCNTVVEALKDSITLDTICKAKLNTKYNNTDTANKRYCYQAVFDFTHY